MMKTLIQPLFIVLLFTASTTAQIYPKLKPLLSWEPIVEMSDHLFPSYILATATMNFQASNDPAFRGDPNGQLGIRIRSDAGTGGYKLVISAPEIMEDATISGYISQRDIYYEAFPKIAYRFTMLASIQQPIPVNVKFSLYVDNELYNERIKVIQVHSINDCPFIQINRKGNALDINYMFAAYVNENEPWISNQLLPQLMNWGTINSFTGYQVNADEVVRQVFTIWAEFQKRGFRYSDISVPSALSQNVRSQYVRFINETVNTSQANCVDGTVLFASILRRIGINPVLALTPTHCFLGFYLDREKQRWVFLETTLLGRTDIPENAIDPNFWNTYMNLFNSNVQKKYYTQLKSFIYALQVGNKNYVDIQEHLKSPSLLYLIVDVEDARSKGVMPISYRSNRNALFNR